MQPIKSNNKRLWIPHQILHDKTNYSFEAPNLSLFITHTHTHNDTKKKNLMESVKLYVIIFGKDVEEKIGFVFCDCLDDEFFIRREYKKASTASLREFVIRKTPHKANWIQRRLRSIIKGRNEHTFMRYEECCCCHH